MEIWKDIKGYEGLYQVSNMGNIRSLDREIYNKSNRSYCFTKGRVLKGNSRKNWYKQVRLYNNEHKAKTHLVHRLVAEYFVPKVEGKEFVNHIDGNKENAIYTNLEWVTAKENSIHAIKTGLTPIGQNSTSAKLNDQQVMEIRSKISTGKYSCMTVAKEYGISDSTVEKIVDGRLWKHLPLLGNGIMEGRKKRPKQNRGLPESDVINAYNRYKEGKSIRSLAKEMNTTHTRLRNSFKYYGLNKELI